MRKILLLAYSLFAAFSSQAQQYHVDSTRFITGIQPGTNIISAIPTADNGILFVGSEGDAPGGIIPSFSLDVTYRNVMVGKIDRDQKISWIKVYGGSKEDGAGSACQTPDGGYAVLCATSSSDGDVIRNRTGDIWLLRLDGNGNIVWQSMYGTSSHGDGPFSIANTPDGGFIMLASTSGNDGDAPFHYGSTFNNDWLVIKTDGSGNVQWSKTIGGNGDEQDYGQIISVGSNYYIASGTNSQDHDCVDTAWHAGAGGTSDDGYLVKLDNSGNVLWAKSYGGNKDDIFYSLLYDDRENTLVMTGVDYSSDYMCTDQHGEGDMFTVKTDMDGNIIWHKSLGHRSEDVGKCIIKSNTGGYLLYGSTFPNADTTAGAIGGVDNMLISIDKDGNELAYKIWGGRDGELPYKIVPYLSTYAAVGSTYSAAFTEGTCNDNHLGGFISYLGAGRLSVNNLVPSNAVVVIYPNPSHTSVTIRIPHSSGKGMLTIVGSNGKVIWEERTKPGAIEVNTAQWSVGIYMVQWVAHDGSVLVGRMVKN